MKRLLVMMLLMAGLFALQAAYYAPRLPDRVASHFNAHGEPDGWADKSTFLILSVILPLIVVSVFVTAEGITQALASAAIRKAAPSSEPSADEQQVRQQQAGRAAIRHWSDFMFWIGTGMMVFLFATLHMAIRANLTPPPVLRHVWPTIAVYLLFVALLGVRLAVRLRETTRDLPRPERPPDVWFPAKRFGWGWGFPCCWQGWVVMIGWLIAVMIGLVALLRGEPSPLRFGLVSLFVIAMSGLFIAICWAKGEKPRWRWGE